MAETVDIQRLMVSMNADLRKLTSQMAKGNALVNRRTYAIQRRFDQMNSHITGSFGKLGVVIGGALSLRAAQQLIDGSTRIQNALRATGLEGEALTKVYDDLFKSAQDNAVPMEALVKLYSRAAQVQKELGVSSRDLTRFADDIAVSLRAAGTSAEESSGALLQLSQALGGGVVRAEEFSSLLEGAPGIAKAAAIGIEEAGGSVAKLRQYVVDGKVSSAAFFRAIGVGAETMRQQLGSAEATVSDQFVRLQNVLQDAAGKIDKIAGAGTKAKSGLGALADGIEEIAGNKDRLEEIVVLAERLAGAWAGAKVGRMVAGNRGALVGGALGALAPELAGLMEAEDALVSLNREAAQLRSAIDAMKASPMNDDPLINAEQLRASEAALDGVNQKIAETIKLRATAALGDLGSWMERQVGAVAAATGSGTAGPKPITLANYPVDPNAGGGGKSDADRQAEQIARVREELAFQADQLTRTAREQEIYNQLKAAGVSIDSEAGEAIAVETGALYDREQALARNTERMEMLGDATQAFASTLISGLREGKSAVESFTDALDSLASKLTDDLINNLVSNLAGALTKTGGLSGANAPLYARGGLVRAASGGRISGPGTGTSDSILAKVSNGEFVVNAKATRRHFPLLEALNEGRLRAFAAGGRVGGGGGAGSVGGVTVKNTVVNNTSSQVRQEERRDGNGNIEIITMIDDAVAGNIMRSGTKTNRALRAGGWQRPLR